MEGKTSISLNPVSLFCSKLPVKQDLSNNIQLTSCVVHVLCRFSTESLKTSREFSLLFENTIKT